LAFRAKTKRQRHLLSTAQASEATQNAWIARMKRYGVGEEGIKYGDEESGDGQSKSPKNALIALFSAEVRPMCRNPSELAIQYKSFCTKSASGSISTYSQGTFWNPFTVMIG